MVPGSFVYPWPCPAAIGGDSFLRDIDPGLPPDAQGQDATFDLLQLGFYVPLAFLLGFHQEVNLLFFREHVVGVHLPRQKPGEDPPPHHRGALATGL